MNPMFSRKYSLVNKFFKIQELSNNSRTAVNNVYFPNMNKIRLKKNLQIRKQF